ncbi:hypothetical protein LCGC14_0407530 [marine sediment metagenome]|uniref:Uncharacterized protein n=1 Tax=marine sediment metagenome TaxID=412755 RepID=A0A0F9VH16_9ZZZZ
MTIRHQNPDLRDASGNRIVPRVLLETQTVVSPTGTVTLTLPATPYNRFQIEIDQLSSVANNVDLQSRIGVNGTFPVGASDYTWLYQAHAANDNGSLYEDISDDSIIMSGGSGNANFGSASNSTFNYSCWLYPGTDATDFPRIGFEAAGWSDTSVLARIDGFGMYKGQTTLQFGRIENITFSMTSDNIERGTFRLYGTE